MNRRSFVKTGAAMAALGTAVPQFIFTRNTFAQDGPAPYSNSQSFSCHVCRSSSLSSVERPQS